jgi:predicted amidohydrolase
MRGAMKVLPRIQVGLAGADLNGSDHRALQAAVDYVAGLGGGVVEIGEGTFTLRDSLHLRSHVTVRGAGEKTILRKAPAAASRLALDGDFGEEQVTVADAAGFEVGDGVAIWDDDAGGFHTTVATITGKDGDTFAISKPLNADCMVGQKARAATVFPVVSGYDVEGAVVEDLVIDGARARNVHLNGCRGAGIFLYRAHGTVLRRCRVHDYSGDGISFQQSNDVQVLACVSEDNTHLGIHPGSGSQRPRVASCVARRNGEDGLFLCWRVRHGTFTENQLIENGRFGISIGHKDTDNWLAGNVVRANGHDGIRFRDESEGMAGHRNRLERNVIEDNGRDEPAAGIRIDGETRGVVLRGNTIRDSRSGDGRTQRTAVRIGERASEVLLEDNRLEGEVEDRRPRAPGATAPAPGPAPVPAPAPTGERGADASRARGADAVAATSRVRLALLKAVPIKWDLEGNFKVFLAELERASASRPDLFVTPEGWLDGYAAAAADSTRERLGAVAQDLEQSPYLRRVAAEAARLGIHICFGFTSREGGKLHNAAGLWGPDGKRIGVYHKTHLQTHDLQFAAGDSLPVWPTPWGPLGIMICADRRWPETARTLRLQGAKLILNPSYGMCHEANEWWMRTRGYENQCFIAFTHPEVSLVVGPRGELAAKLDRAGPAVLIHEVDLAEAKDDNHLRDRRPDLYRLIGETASARAPGRPAAGGSEP